MPTEYLFAALMFSGCITLTYALAYLTIRALGLLADLWHATRIKVIRAYQAQRLEREMGEEIDR